jgi:hypothetical protein
MIRFRLSIIMLNMADSSSALFSLTVSLTTPFFMSIIIARAETIWTIEKNRTSNQTIKQSEQSDTDGGPEVSPATRRRFNVN